MLANEDKFLTQVARELLDKRDVVVIRVRSPSGENIAIYEKLGGEVILDKYVSISHSIVSTRVSSVKRIVERSKKRK